jgi:WD40 repeat protein
MRQATFSEPDEGIEMSQNRGIHIPRLMRDISTLPTALIICSMLIGAVGALVVKADAQDSKSNKQSIMIAKTVLSADGTAEAISWSDGRLQLWNLDQGQLSWEVISPKGFASLALALSPDSHTLATAEFTDIKLLDVGKGRQQGIIADGQIVLSNVIAFSLDGKILALGDPSGAISTWDVESGRKMGTFAGHSANITCLAFSKNGQWLASGSADKTVILWELATGKELAQLKGHTEMLNSLAFSWDSRRLATSAFEGLVNIWEIPSGKNLLSFTNQVFGNSFAVSAVAWSPDDTMLAGVSIGEGSVWNSATGRKAMNLEGLPAGADMVLFGSAGKQIFVGASDGTVQVINADTGKLERTFVPASRN